MNCFTRTRNKYSNENENSMCVQKIKKKKKQNKTNKNSLKITADIFFLVSPRHYRKNVNRKAVVLVV